MRSCNKRPGDQASAGDNIVSLNVNHSRYLGGLMDIIALEDPSIICLQEVIQNTDELTLLVRGKGYKASVSPGPNKKPGVAILYKEGETTALIPGQIMKLATEKWTIYNIYGPAGSQNQEVRREFFGITMLGLLQSEDKQPILIGDWNCITRCQDTESNPQRKLCPELKQLLQYYKYTDCHIKLNGDRISWTFQRQHMSPSRLDRAYAPKTWCEKIVECKHLPTLSDHKALVIKMDSGTNTPKREASSTYWKLNTKVLHHESFLNTFQDFWQKEVTNKPEYQTWADWWEDTFKPRVKMLLQSLSKERIVFRRDTRTYLYQALDKATQAGNWIIANRLKSRLQKMLLEDLEGLIVRSGGKEWIDEEKGCIYHLGREMKRGATGNVNRLKVAETVLTDPQEIEKEVLQFYTALFNGQHRTIEHSQVPVDTGIPFQEDLTYLDTFTQDIGKINQQDKNYLDQPIQLGEIIEALKTSPKHRAPGLDGLPHEFYQTTVGIIGPTLVLIFREQLERGEIIESGKNGVTRLIPKVEGVPTIQQLRPITLLNCDYKLMSKVLATRMNKILPNLLTSSQLCSRKNRTILSGVSDIVSALEYIKENRSRKGYILSLDAYKAFDKANVKLIYKIMEKMEFSSTFISWIRAMHTGAGTCLILNKLSQRIEVPLSLRQGDNIAMPLFLIAMEPLLKTLDRNLEGLQVGPTRIKSMGYVDDIQVVSGKEEDLTKVAQIFKDFESLSGMVLSKAKTKILGLGQWREKEDWILQWARPVDEMKAFGVTFQNTTTKTLRASWKDCQESIKKCMMAWGARSIQNIQQKAFIISTYALSKIWYLGQVLPPPEGVVQEVEKVCRRYLWQGRLEHLAWEELWTNKAEGGLGIPNIRSKCDALMLRHTNKGIKDPISQQHLRFWIGQEFQEEIPDLRGNQHAATQSTHFKKVSELIRDGLNQDLPLQAKAKNIYQAFTSTLPSPKIQFKLDLPWEQVYSRIWNKVLSMEQQDLLFTLINNIYPTKERLFRLNQHRTGNCASCEVLDTNLHSFLHCQDVQPLWNYLLQQLPDIISSRTGTPEDEWLLLSYEETGQAKVKLYVIAQTLQFIHLKRKSGEPMEIDPLRSWFNLATASHNARENGIIINL